MRAGDQNLLKLSDFFLALRSSFLGGLQQAQSKTRHLLSERGEKKKKQPYESKRNEEKTLYMEAGWTALESENTTDAVDEYTYKTEDQLQTGSVSGYLGSYGGGGYAVSLSGTAAEMVTLFNQLENDRWIDEYTRAVIIEFSTYNAQVNYFSVVQLLVEIPKSGVYLTNSWVESTRCTNNAFIKCARCTNTICFSHFIIVD
uniref:Polycystin domain-containing protein n=1 Tax=Caenorhabditis japonica TaxID=281687 RepID=A0A8R1IK66_CAEJA